MKKKYSAIALMLAVAFLLSIFTVSVFATDVVTPESTPSSGDVTTPSSDVTTAEPSGDTTPTGTTAPSTTATTTTSGGFPLHQIIPLGIFVVVLIVLAVVFFGLPKYRERTLKFCRSIKSECKKVSWYSWKNTRKGTLIVIISVVALAIVIGLLDVLFSTFINTLTKIF